MEENNTKHKEISDDLLQKQIVSSMIKIIINFKGEDIDICEYYGDPGIGYNELRYLFVDDNNNPIFESNNVHEYELGEDIYKKFQWQELSNYEKAETYRELTKITNNYLKI